jgi:GNAT superfamily N-acetyltransferase
MTTNSGNQRERGHDLADVAFVPRRVDHPDAAKLLKAFYDEQVGRYGFAESVDLNPDSYDLPHGIFVVIYDRGRPVGCGGCRRLKTTGDTVEIKKTYLVPDVRGRGLSRRLLGWLEDRAELLGGHRIILETGIRNAAALALFRSSGYTRTESYVPGRDPSINRAFVKTLTGSRAPATAGDAQRASA